MTQQISVKIALKQNNCTYLQQPHFSLIYIKGVSIVKPASLLYFECNVLNDGEFETLAIRNGVPPLKGQPDQSSSALYALAYAFPHGKSAKTACPKIEKRNVMFEQ